MWSDGREGRWASVGVLEVSGFVAALAVLDAMTKSAEVRHAATILVGDGLVAVAVTGSIASVRWALDTAAGLCRQQGWPVTLTALGRPDPAVVATFELAG